MAEVVYPLNLGLWDAIRLHVQRIHLAPEERQDVQADHAAEAVTDDHDPVVAIALVDLAQELDPSDRIA